MNEADMLDLAEKAIDFALDNGARQAAAAVSKQNIISLAWRDNKLERTSEAEKCGMSLRLFVNNRYSQHGSNDLRLTQIYDFINRGIATTSYLAEDEFRSLPDPDSYPAQMPPSEKSLRLVDPETFCIKHQDRLDYVQAAAEKARSADDSIISVTAGYSSSFGVRVLLHSNGFIGWSRRSFFSADTIVTIEGGAKGNRPSGYDYAGCVFRGDLPQPEVISMNALKRARDKLNQEKISSGTYNMVVENRAAGRLMEVLLGAMSGRALQQKSSFLEGLQDQTIASDKLTIIDDPFLEKQFASRLFDGEGLEACRKPIIENGILRQFYIDTYYGKKLGLKPTSGSRANLTFALGNKNADEICSTIRKGIWVNEFIGGNANQTTGDFSLGISGSLIENGKFVKPVNEMNISGNMLSLWRNLAEIGNDPVPYSSIHIPCLHFTEVHFSGS